MEWMVIEQRKKQRFDLKLPFEILRADAGKTIGDTQNLSSSGVLFSVSAPIRIGEPIEYYLILPKVPGTNRPLRLRCFGTVVREAPESIFAATLDRHEFVRNPES